MKKTVRKSVKPAYKYAANKYTERLRGLKEGHTATMKDGTVVRCVKAARNSRKGVREFKIAGQRKTFTFVELKQLFK